MSINITPSITIFFTILLSLLLSSSFSSSSYNDEQPDIYIVQVSKLDKPSIFSSHLDWYTSALESLPAHLSLSSHPREVIVYTYNHAIHGFSARLTPSQASYIRSFPGIRSVLPQQIRQIQTTRTPSFLGLNPNSGLWPVSGYGSEIIIGVLDSGIWPESKSFNESGLTNPLLTKWRGVCQTTSDFPATSCNKKIVGARFFNRGSVLSSKDLQSPRDTEGHGTHTASTAAGSLVQNVGFYNYAVGDVRGMATNARIASYKVCWSTGCADADVVAGIDQAVADGVDVISMSLGGSEGAYYLDTVTIAAFGAVEKGVLVSAAAMNERPNPSTANNLAPWFLTVGASTIDRQFPCDVILGDGRTFSGVSLYSGQSLGNVKIALVYAGDIGGEVCEAGKLNPTLATGKIVLCAGGDIVAQGNAVRIAGGVGLISADGPQRGVSGEGLMAHSPTIPGAKVIFPNALAIVDYIRSQPNPVASLVFRGTVLGSPPSAPKVAAFSGRGPNHLTPEILKPDVIAPGVNVLAAWTGAAGPSDLDFDTRRVAFNIMSGTSVACPHVSGLAAMIRKVHPNWTPGAVKSALMTTAYNVDNGGKPITDMADGGISNPFQHGAGHVDPNKATNPGLVYDIQPSNYDAFLCSLGYSQTQISLFVKNRIVDCALNKLAAGPGDLNLPSFSVVFKTSLDSVVKYKRVVTNVGSQAVASYSVKVTSPPSVQISVSPSVLQFTSTNQKLSYEVTFTSLIKNDPTNAKSEFGAIEWNNGVYIVRSPVALVWKASTTILISSF
ncbi:hypothetical protein C5167_027413 [Papaver somniferum]|uniref:subtilisin-like protease SBT1.4 n=1 Tax=Papaver somniferum TaxID=3469 RepID=UPI000E704DE8|nr:subtilisin-like protease SBT1.4 [Papaver somniferum]RZC91353.1 hypothetical protein C5167_027413 [Papaver somniferum]